MNPQSQPKIRNLALRWSGVYLLLFLLIASGQGQTLNLPSRPTDARAGSEVAKMLISLGVPNAGDNRKISAREAAICGQLLQGNVPDWLRQMTLITTNATINGTNYTVSFYSTPDYLAIGSDEDYFRTPMTPLLAQYLANKLACTLPTAKMVNDIWRKAPCKLSPSPISPTTNAIETVPIFIVHNNTVHNQRFAVTNSHPLGTLVGGTKKDVVIANRVYTMPAPPRVCIYGWHYLDGTYIQPLSTAHEETYVDYSHGIRLIEMGISLNGQSNTVTNALQNAATAAVLSDDNTLAGNVITTPRYPTFVPVAPIITMHPSSHSVRSGSTVTLSAFAFGDGSLTYQWKSNGTNIPGAAAATLTLTNMQAAQAGTYTLVVSNSVGFTNCIPALLKVANPTHVTLFADDFETNSAANWNVTWGTTNGIADYTVDWAYDYSGENYMFNGAGYFIPPAPNSSGTSRGVKLTVNSGDTSGVIFGVNLYPKNKTFSNDYALKFDLWMNYPGNAGGATAVGSTQHALFGLNHLGTNANWAAPSAVRTDGIWFAVDGEGGDARDYRAYVGNINGTQAELIGATSGLSQSNNTAAIYQTLFPSSRFETAGAPGKQWVEVEVRQVGGVVTWLIDGTTVAQRNNSSTFTNGTIMLGYMDVFNSIASPSNHAFVLFDNVRVEDLNQPLQAPTITNPPQNQQCTIGSNAIFSVTATGTVPIGYQWYFNEVLLSGRTNATLQLTNVQPSQAGTYKVVVSNIVTTTNVAATLTVNAAPARFHGVTQNSGDIAFTVSGSPGIQYQIETSTNLTTWDPLATLMISNGFGSFSDPISASPASRFYRAKSIP